MRRWNCSLQAGCSGFLVCSGESVRSVFLSLESWKVAVVVTPPRVLRRSVYSKAHQAQGRGVCRAVGGGVWRLVPVRLRRDRLWLLRCVVTGSHLVVPSLPGFCFGSSFQSCRPDCLVYALVVFGVD